MEPTRNLGAIPDIHTMIMDELFRAIEKHPTWPVDMVHKVAIVAEESGELIRAAVQFAHESEINSESEIMKEAIQTAATCVRLLIHLAPDEYGRPDRGMAARESELINAIGYREHVRGAGPCGEPLAGLPFLELIRHDATLHAVYRHYLSNDAAVPIDFMMMAIRHLVAANRDLMDRYTHEINTRTTPGVPYPKSHTDEK